MDQEALKGRPTRADSGVGSEERCEVDRSSNAELKHLSQTLGKPQRLQAMRRREWEVKERVGA